MPPRLDARAMPSTKALLYVDLDGSVRRIGWISEKHSTGAATFEIHIDAKQATPMYASNTAPGLVPASDRTRDARILSMFCFDSAPARVKPPTSRTIVPVNIWLKMYLLASVAVSRLSRPSVERSTRRTTTRKGTSSEVANNGMTCSGRSADVSDVHDMAYLHSPENACQDENGETIAFFHAVEGIAGQD